MTARAIAAPRGVKLQPLVQFTCICRPFDHRGHRGKLPLSATLSPSDYLLQFLILARLSSDG